MPQINLLKQNNSGSKRLEASLPGIIAKALMLVVLLLAGFYGWLYFKEIDLTKQVAEFQSKTQSVTVEITKAPSQPELATRQGQLKEFQKALAMHLYWSGLLPELAKVTLKNANYSSAQVDKTGFITLKVDVPSLQDLDKFLQVFDDPTVNKYFYNVTISSVQNVQLADKISYEFQIKAGFNPAILQYTWPRIAQ